MTVLRNKRSKAGGSRALLGGLLLAVVGTGALAAPAHAAEGSIDHVERDGNLIQVLYSLPDAGNREPNLDTLAVSLNDKTLTADAELATESADALRRTTILAIDVSESMRKDDRFSEAQDAAKAFLDAAPDDLYVGIVTFAGSVEVAQQPSLDRAASARVIDGLELSTQTRLYDGLLEAVRTSGSEGSRSLLVLSDGRDTSGTEIETVIDQIEESGVKVDVVALALSEADKAKLQQLADAGNGSVISADDPEALTQVFAAEADAIARQILISVTPPGKNEPAEGTLTVSVDAGGETYSDSAFVNVSAGTTTGPAKASTELVPVDSSGFQVTEQMMLAGIAAAGVGVLVLILASLGVFRSGRESVEDRISAYTRKGSRKLAAAKGQPEQQGVTAQAVGIAEKALEGQAGLSAALGQKLEAAGMSIKPAEWLLAHFAIAFMAGLVALLLSSGSILWTGVGLLLGVFLPWMYLSFKRSRRVKAFKYGLADTLQLMSGSLSAGLSLAQSLDTVVREGSEPIAGEFRRALVESRLGVEIEDAMESVAERMESVDFEWVVMAIRIQREVGGNLSELLTNVAATIREREYLERQVLALSAEGRRPIRC